MSIDTNLREVQVNRTVALALSLVISLVIVLFAVTYTHTNVRTYVYSHMYAHNTHNMCVCAYIHFHVNTIFNVSEYNYEVYKL